MTSLDLFQHKILSKNGVKTIFLLHGTGGTEEDLFPLVEPFQKSYTIVGLRGNINESGMARFFKRHGEGDFDQESIKKESGKLADFIQEWEKTHDTTPADMTFVGYSNGANLILATLFYHPQLIQKAALLHPMLPFWPNEDLNLSGNNILLSWSSRDPIVSRDASEEVIEALRRTCHADIDIVQTDHGHAITQAEVDALHSFIAKK